MTMQSEITNEQLEQQPEPSNWRKFYNATVKVSTWFCYIFLGIVVVLCMFAKAGSGGPRE